MYGWSMHPGVARAFPVRKAAHSEQNNEEKLTEKMRKMRKEWRKEAKQKEKDVGKVMQNLVNQDFARPGSHEGLRGELLDRT